MSLIYEGATDQDFDYQQDSTSLIIGWSGSDATAREITDYLACLGTSPSDTNVVNWTAVGNTTTHTFNGLNLEEGVTYYANVQAIDNAGNISGVFSGDGITIDQSSPVTGQVNDGTGIDIDWVNINYLARVNWTGFHDSLSGIAEYEYSLGLDTGQTEIVDWISSGLDTSITVSYTHLTLPTKA